MELNILAGLVVNERCVAEQPISSLMIGYISLGVLGLLLKKKVSTVKAPKPQLIIKKVVIF